MRTNKLIALACAVFAIAISSCVKDPANSITTVATVLQTHVLWVVNEGDYGHGNSTLDCFELDTGIYHDNLYLAVNRTPLGDNANDLVVGRGDSLFAVINNSDMIRLINRRTCALMRTYAMPPGTSPYKMVFVSDSLAAVTGYGTSRLILLNIRTGAIVQSIPTGSNPQGVAFTGSTICVCAPGLGGTKEMDLIDPATGTLRTVNVGDNPLVVTALDDTSAVALCQGDWSPTTSASLVFFNTASAVASTVLTLPGHPAKMALDGRVLYVPVDSVVYRFDMQLRERRDSFKLDRAAYGITVDNATHIVYLSDAKNFAQRGDLSVYDQQMNMLSRMPTGINPGTLLVLH